MKLKLKASELLDLRGLRKLCRLRSYDVLEVKKRKVVLQCVRHGEWEDQQLRVLANSAECPKCGKTRPHGYWSFSAEEWKDHLRVLQPHIKYIGKSPVLEGRSLFRHKCRKCGTKFKNSLTALTHPRFKCPECAYELPEDQQLRSTRYRANLKTKVRKACKERDRDFYMQDMKAAYSVLKELGVVEFPPQIELKVKAKPVAKVKSETKIKEKLEEPELDPEDQLVQILEVKTVEAGPKTIETGPPSREDEVLHLVEEGESSELELSDSTDYVDFQYKPQPRATAVYASRNGSPPITPHGQLLNKNAKDYYGV